MPPHTRYVGRPTRFGNPFGRPGSTLSYDQQVDEYVLALYRGDLKVSTDDILRDLFGCRNIACWCPLERRCHGDVIVAVLNGDADAIEEYLLDHGLEPGGEHARET